MEEKETIQHFFLITGENKKKGFFCLKGSFHKGGKEIWEMCGSPALPCHRSLGPEIRDDGFCALFGSGHTWREGGRNGLRITRVLKKPTCVRRTKRSNTQKTAGNGGESEIKQEHTLFKDLRKRHVFCSFG